jgi:uncharacterized protein (TIGR03437 family)
MKLARKLLLICAAVAPAFAAGPAWDSSGNSQLNGVYNFRQVLYISNGSGTIGQQIAYFGSITFNGSGAYTLSSSNTQLNTGTALSIPAAGTYSVASSGYGFLSNPLIAGASVHFLVTNHILLGSSTEIGGSGGSFTNDLFIATPATPSFTNASFTGGYTLAGYRPGNGTPAGASDWLYQLTANGAGNLTTASISGYTGNGSTILGPYALNNTPYSVAGGTLTTTLTGSSSPYAGPYLLYLSPDANFVFGGSPTGYDMVVGVRNTVGNAEPISPGLYYEAGLDEDETNANVSIDTYYGVFNNSAGGTIGNERLLYAGSSAESYTYTTTYPPGGFIPTSIYNGPSDIGQFDYLAMVRYTVGADLIRIGLGIGPYLGIDVAIPAAAPTPSGTVFIDPTGIVNTASSAPFIAGVSPGEFVTLYNGVNTSPVAECWTSGPPFPTNLAGVQVIFNGTFAAPIYCVSSQITVIVPYEVSASPITSIQVVNNGVPSNIVTAYVYPATPGVFSYPAGGIGFAAAQHGDYSLVTTANPALKGETIVVYLSGVGNVVNSTGDGDASPLTGDNVTANVQVYVDGVASPSVPYAGLTPGTAGLYQINFQIPMTSNAGTDSLAITGAGSFFTEATLPVGPVTSTTIPFIPGVVASPERQRSPAVVNSKEPFTLETQ